MSREQHSKSDQGDLASDIIWGVDGKNGIAKFLNVPPAKAYYLIRKRAIPIRRHGHRTISASRTELRRVFTTSDS